MFMVVEERGLKGCSRVPGTGSPFVVSEANVRRLTNDRCDFEGQARLTAHPAARLGVIGRLRDACTVGGAYADHIFSGRVGREAVFPYRPHVP